MTLFFVALIALLAFLVQGFTGFGSALVLAPLLLFFLDLKTAVVASAMVQVPIGLWLILPVRRMIDYAALSRLLPISIAGLAAGTFALTALHVEWLKQLCGVLTVVFAARILLRNARQHDRVPWPNWAGYLAGLTGGVLGGLFGTSGPPIVAYLENQLAGRAAMRATLLAYFLVLNTLRVAGYTGTALVNGPVLTAVLAMIPASMLGAWLGARLHHRVEDRSFRMLVGAVLLCTGLLLAVGV